MMVARLIIYPAIVFMMLTHSWHASAQVWFKQAGDLSALMSADSQYLSGFIYTETSDFSEGLAWVNKGDLYGYINDHGDSVTSFVYTDVESCQNGFAIVSKDSLYGFINHQGKERTNFRYDRIKSFEYDVTPALLDTSWVLIDTLGNMTCDVAWDYPPIVISKNFVIGRIEKKWGVTDAKGVEVYPFIYDIITDEGVAYIGEQRYYLGLR